MSRMRSHLQWCTGFLWMCVGDLRVKVDHFDYSQSAVHCMLALLYFSDYL
jgi:hypothetical protein